MALGRALAQNLANLSLPSQKSTLHGPQDLSRVVEVYRDDSRFWGPWAESGWLPLGLLFLLWPMLTSCLQPTHQLPVCCQCGAECAAGTATSMATQSGAATSVHQLHALPWWHWAAYSARNTSCTGGLLVSRVGRRTCGRQGKECGQRLSGHGPWQRICQHYRVEQLN